MSPLKAREMSPRLSMLPTLIVIWCAALAHGFSRDDEAHEHFTNDWVVGVSGGSSVADSLARELGYKNVGELKGFPDAYLMRKIDHPRRSRRHAEHITKRLSEDRRVEWAEQQVAKRREKRGVFNLDEIPEENHWMPGRKESGRFNDELWPDQWYLHDTRAMDNLPKLDLRVTAAWDMGYTGKGIVITVMDDGLEWNHTDLIGNYDEEASWDSNDEDNDPFPRYDDSDSNNHGTRCAGEIAMTADNRKCGVGVAYEARIGGIRMLDGTVTDAVECNSIAHKIDYIDIYSASWGPSDDGRTVDGPNKLALKALEKGAHEGRGGKGVIYVWASGNGGSKGDNCNCDGYTNSIYTLSVGSASQRGEFPWYGEKCASTMTTAYSSGAYMDQKISTTDLRNECTIHHTGTSAAAPLAAGIIALILEANPNLTWRDMQHLVAWNSDYYWLKNNRGWRRNSAGLMYNSRFGFGLMNAGVMVAAARNWTTVPHKTSCTVKTYTKLPLKIASEVNDEVEVYFNYDDCKGSTGIINFLEHVEVTLDIDYNHRGALDIYLFSPSGTISMLLSRRQRDTSSVGFKRWTFLTVHLWGENPDGKWKILIRDKVGKTYRGAVNLAMVTFHGTADMPAHMRRGRRFTDEHVLQNVIDTTPEFEEENPTSRQQDTSEDQDLFEMIREKELDWDDLVSKQIRNTNSKYWKKNLSRLYSPRLAYYLMGERDINYATGK